VNRSERAKLVAFQGKLCALCGAGDGSGRGLAIDRESKSGDVCGLLCQPCRALLAHTKRNPLFHYRALNYLAGPPYQRMNEGTVGPDGESDAVWTDFQDGGNVVDGP